MASFFVEPIETPVGRMLLVTDTEGRVHAADWEDNEERMHRLLSRLYGAAAPSLRATSRAPAARRALEAYFEGDMESLAGVVVAPGGTPFQRAVWDALRRIPPGSTVSYSELARTIGSPSAVRAVGMANASNPVAVIVPCHRVIGADARLTGYAGGLERKRWLLAHEKAPAGHHAR